VLAILALASRRVVPIDPQTLRSVLAAAPEDGAQP
jgi:hypothetical protein